MSSSIFFNFLQAELSQLCPSARRKIRRLFADAGTQNVEQANISTLACQYKISFTCFSTISCACGIFPFPVAGARFWRTFGEGVEVVENTVVEIGEARGSMFAREPRSMRARARFLRADHGWFAVSPRGVTSEETEETTTPAN